MRYFFTLVAFVLILPLFSCDNGTSASSTSPSLSLLYIQEAHGGGSLATVNGQSTTFTLTFNNVGPTMYVADRPNRISGSESTATFVADWDSNKFNTNPPNAVLEVNNLAGTPTTMAVELSNPQYDAASQTLTYTAQQLETYPSFYPTSANDGNINGDFTSATLFIDNGGTTSTLVSFAINNYAGNQGNLEILLSNGNDLNYGMAANAQTPSMFISNPSGTGISISSLSLSSNNLVIQFPNTANSNSFTLNLYLVGSSPFLEATATIPNEVSVNMTINGITTSISSGFITAPLY